jgi:3-phosphoshikimate 1-carboxyvinyltransferase
MGRPSTLRAVDLRIPGDFSAAAYWLVAAVLHPNASIRLRDVGVNPTRTGLLDALRAMGAKIRVENERWEGGEPVADLWAESSSLEGTEVAGDMIPRLIDEAPVLAVAAALARGTTVIRDAAELRVKESDRIATTTDALRRLGADIDELPDGMVIRGRGLKAVASKADHRLAMALAVAGLLAEGGTAVQDAEAVAVSYPRFWEDIHHFTGA